MQKSSYIILLSIGFLFFMVWLLALSQMQAGCREKAMDQKYSAPEILVICK